MCKRYRVRDAVDLNSGSIGLANDRTCTLVELSALVIIWYILAIHFVHALQSTALEPPWCASTPSSTKWPACQRTCRRRWRIEAVDVGKHDNYIEVGLEAIADNRQYGGWISRIVVFGDTLRSIIIRSTAYQLVAAWIMLVRNEAH